MDDDYAPGPIARWFMPAAIATLLFMAAGCASYLMHVATDPASLPIDRRAAFEAEPAWVTGAYAVAVWAGLAGAILLVMKRKLAETALLVSVVAVLVWLAGLLLVTDLREALSANDLVVAIVVAALTWTIFWFARHSRQREWLR
jgi:hypothetical protein